MGLFVAHRSTWAALLPVVHNRGRDSASAPMHFKFDQSPDTHMSAALALSIYSS